MKIGYVNLFQGCTNPYCINVVKDYDKLLGVHIGNKTSPKFTSAVLDFSRWSTFEDYYNQVKKEHHNMHESYNKAKRTGFYCKQFNKNNFNYDWVEIRQSKKIRDNRPIPEIWSKDSVDKQGGSSNELQPLDNIICSKHNSYIWGCFIERDGYKQGNLITNEKLVGYIAVVRKGNIANYDMLLGHGDFLKYGIMPYLHFKIMEWIYQEMKDLQYLFYSTYNNKKSGIQIWKERLLFEPMGLILDR